MYQSNSRTVEILVAAAFGAAILSVVFMAFPNLKSTSDDKLRDTDVAMIGSAVDDYVNANGELPDTWQQSILDEVTLFYYMPQDIIYETDLSTNSGLLASLANFGLQAADQLEVIIYAQAVCGDQNGEVVAAQATDFAIVYYRQSDQGFECKDF